ncbi:MAG: hypothetical protein PHU27_00300 [Salinivirgaceae bacterium]|nr:hypothetical protein [Salinivirgaceae bacterium]MDD4746209.1 hypothetical protein [Salinivirgaceae bacterium]MDY0279370.1 hypothetical protein [Salinivirgaceae bacterium]
MRTRFYFLVALIALSLPAFSGEIVINGIYQGKNLYIMNPFSSIGGFCVQEISVNGQTYTEDINSSAFEINFTAFQFNFGDKIVVTIKHKDDCKPRILNDDVLKPRSTFEVKTLRFDMKTNTINWETTKESGALPYIIEQFRWNKWIKVGTVEGKGSVSTNEYSFDVDLISGVNRFRIFQNDFTNRKRYTKEVAIRSAKAPVTFEPKKPSTSITFSAETTYEIFNGNGERVLYGKGSTVDITNLPKGDYYLNFDSLTETFKKR